MQGYAYGMQEEYDSSGYDLDWQDQRQAEWEERIQAQYFSRWSVDKHDEWQAYRAKFEAANAMGGAGGTSSRALPQNAALTPPQWDTLTPSRSTAADARDAEDYRKRHDMQVISAFSSSAVPVPIQTFEASNLPPEVYREIQEAGFTEPTPIQAQCWPILAAGHDLIGIAKSGSGKTLAFLGPGFAHVLRSTHDVQRGPIVLVLAPTRELARQIQLEALKFGRSSGILCCAVTGGEPKGEQLEWLKRGCHVIVATPGRLNEFLEQQHVSLGQVGYAVMDEADRMLDMGFEPQIRRIVEECPKGPERQTLLFSATWPKVVRQLAFDFLRRPVHVHIGEMNAAKANPDVHQQVLLLDRPTDKDQALEDTLREQLNEDELSIVFVSTKKACQDVSRRLQGRNFAITEIHGDKDQRERDLALRSFMSKTNNVMIATDVASRGLDIKGVKLVINYDAANTPEDYVHRIGRTGRAGEKGISYTFLVRGDPSDIKKARAIAEVMQTAGQEVSEELRQMAGQPVPRSGGKGGFKGGFKGGGKGGVGGKGGKGGFKGGRGMMMKGGPKGDAVLGGGARPGQGGVKAARESWTLAVPGRGECTPTCFFLRQVGSSACLMTASPVGHGVAS
eukprot:CAMPEP_0171181794 /NCGR_PEP_ID=MMETSP0790-20130122/14438_1 /TAXON_ID=2925 /ORGANISM="Alexandrium catenella, Strain OF101" /LENGTH=619 /DNA_ID=CAMNT_0011646733 /DNA_START=24 /DNA_END=1879 /DNA_ORIENTATION=-